MLSKLATRPVVHCGTIRNEMLLSNAHKFGNSGTLACSALVLLFAAAGLSLALVGCSKPDQAAQPTAQTSPIAEKTAAAAEPMAPIEPCGLLTSEEIASVQGEAVVGTKPSQNAAQGLAMYDCFFTLPTFTNSVSLSVTQSSPRAPARDARESWRETMAAADAKASEKVGPSRKIEGVGDAAFWTGNERMGALYVLKGDRYLRISVGGPGEQEAKIQKSRTLAEAALKRM